MKKYFLTLALMAATALGTFTLRADDHKRPGGVNECDGCGNQCCRRCGGTSSSGTDQCAVHGTTPRIG